jgi:hypothetical protein
MDSKKQDNTFIFIVNIFHLICWLHILMLTIVYYFSDNLEIIKFKESLTFLFIILKITQTLQFSDTIFSIFNFVKGSVLGSILQIGGRNIIVWLILSSENSKEIICLTLINWAFADSVRYAYYLRNNRITKLLRYLFLFKFLFI